MKILIQDKLTGLYKKDSEQWVREVGEAKDFDNTSSAERFCREHQLKNVQVVLKFSPEKWDILLPVDPVLS